MDSCGATILTPQSQFKSTIQPSENPDSDDILPLSLQPQLERAPQRTSITSRNALALH